MQREAERSFEQKSEDKNIILLKNNNIWEEDQIKQVEIFDAIWSKYIQQSQWVLLTIVEGNRHLSARIVIKRMLK